MNEKYHSVIIPLADVYDSGGEDVFESLSRKKKGGKNLIILPSRIGDKISLNVMGKDALKLLAKKEKVIPLGNSNTIITKLDEGVDVAYIIDESPINKRNILTKELKEEICRISGLTENEIKILTKNPNDNLFYSSKGQKVEEPSFLTVDSKIVYEGMITGSNKLYSQLYQHKGKINLKDAENILERNLFPNQFIKFLNENGCEYGKVEGKIEWNKESGKIKSVSDLVVKLLDKEEYSKQYRIGSKKLDNFLGVYPRDMEQYLAVQHGILNPDNEITFLTGSQGSGKTILGYTTSVALILKYDKESMENMGISPKKDSFFKQIVLLKPNNPMGGRDRDEGFLPGNLWEKINPRLVSFKNAHEESLLGRFRFKEMILDPRKENDYGRKRIEKIKINGWGYLPSNKEAIDLTSPAYLKGPTFTNKIVLVDEAQDFTSYELKTIIERLGIGTKCIIMGDPIQFDNPKCSEDNNGLTSLIKHFLPKPQTSLFNLSNHYRIQSSEDAKSCKVRR